MMTEEQRTRRFLADAFKNTVRPSQAEATNESVALRLQFFRVEDEASNAIKKIFCSFYDTVSSSFIGKTYQAGLENTAEICFHVPASCYVIVEAIGTSKKGNDTVLGLYYSAAANFAQLKSLDFMTGSARLFLVPNEKWPANVCRLKVGVNVAPIGPAAVPRVKQVLPAGLAASSAFVSLDDKVEERFRVVLSNFTLRTSLKSPAEGQELLNKSNVSWGLAAQGHNTCKELTKCSPEVEFKDFEQGTWKAKGDVVLEGLPVHQMSSALIRVERREGSQRERFLAVLPLCPNTSELEDADMNVPSLPLLRGPFSSFDTRMICYEAEAPYNRIPVDIGFDVSFFGTPKEAPAITQEEETKAKETPAGATTKPFGATEDDKENIPSNAPKKPLPPKKTSTGGEATTPSTAPLAPQVADLRSLETLVGGRGGEEAYQLLTDIMNEIKNLQAEVRSQTKGDPKELGDPASIVKIQRRPDGKPLAAESIDDTVHVVDLAPRREGISVATRYKLKEKVPQLLHPVTQRRLVDGEGSVAVLPISRIGIRFDGMSVSPGFHAPPRLFAKFAFGTLKDSEVGPMAITEQASDNDIGTTYSISGNSSDQIWFEPTIEEQLNVITPERVADWKRHRVNRTLYVHLYDAVSKFYFATATIPMSKFRRTSSQVSTVVETDINLSWDASLGGLNKSHQFFPLLSFAGQLHVTLVDVGSPNPSSGSSAKSATRRQSSAIVAKKIGVEFGVPEAAPSSKPEPALENRGAEPQVGIHAQRATFVKSMLADEVSRKKLLGGSKDPMATEVEFKVKFAERRRDEMKAARISEMLRERITEQNILCTSRSRPEMMKSVFTNPFPQTMLFHIEVPAQSAKYVSLHASTPASFPLGPKESITLAAVVRVDDDMISSGITVSFAVKTERQETVKIVEAMLEVTDPVVDRRYEMVGRPGSEVKQVFFARTFSSTTMSPEDGPMNLESIYKRVGHLCSHVVVSDSAVRASTKASVDPITKNKVSSWENVEISASVPENPHGEKRFYVFLYRDEGRTALWETWEVIVRPVRTIDTASIYYGQTNDVVIDRIPHDAVYVNDPAVKVLSGGQPGGDTVTLKVQPREPGSHTCVLHVLRGGQCEQVVCNLDCVQRSAEYRQTWQVDLSQTNEAPYALHFTNPFATQMLFKVFHNYRHVLKIEPQVFTLRPGEHQKIKMVVSNLTRGVFPFYICINDRDNKTVSSYLMTVVAEAASQRPITQF